MSVQYKAIFFDWDGTAVVNRSAPVDEIVKPMKALLQKGVKLIIVSGTTYEKIANGSLHSYFSKEELANLYLGLGRGAYNYYFKDGNLEILKSMIPDKKGLLKIHDICYEIHRSLLEQYDFPTDIVFTRPNYCKIDLMVDNIRGTELFMQDDEVENLKNLLKDHGIQEGLKSLIALAGEIGATHGIPVSATCDAKYLEVGTSCKSDNVDIMLNHFKNEGIGPEDCSFWGDEFVGIEEGIFGSDSFMITEQSKSGAFFDVSEMAGQRPGNVNVVGGGIKTFENFLWEQSNVCGI